MRMMSFSVPSAGSRDRGSLNFSARFMNSERSLWISSSRVSVPVWRMLVERATPATRSFIVHTSLASAPIFSELRWELVETRLTRSSTSKYSVCVDAGVLLVNRTEGPAMCPSLARGLRRELLPLWCIICL